MEYSAALAWLYRSQLTGIKLGLGNIHRLLRVLGLRDFDKEARFLHVAGTNGKGSVCAMIDAVSRASGKRTGLFTSPHLVSFRERIRIDGEPVSRQAVADGLTHLRKLTTGWNPAPTFFELTTALAAQCFAEARVEVIAWETGLGGRLDATNAITPAVSVLTAIDMDHMNFLGDTLELVAWEKAGIIKPGVPVVSGPQSPKAATVIETAAAEQQVSLRWFTTPVEEEMTVALAGSHQRINASLALGAVKAAKLPVGDAEARAGLAGVEWPGRFQRLEGGKIVLDGAHNPAAARRLIQTWEEEFGREVRPTLIMGILRDKEASEISRVLALLSTRIYTVQPASPRALSAGDLCSAVRPFSGGREVQAAATLADAIQRAREHPEPILIAGSLFLVGEALALLTPGSEPMEVSWQ